MSALVQAMSCRHSASGYSLNHHQISTKIPLLHNLRKCDLSCHLYFSCMPSRPQCVNTSNSYVVSCFNSYFYRLLSQAPSHSYHGRLLKSKNPGNQQLYPVASIKNINDIELATGVDHIDSSNT